MYHLLHSLCWVVGLILQLFKNVKTKKKQKQLSLLAVQRYAVGQIWPGFGLWFTDSWYGGSILYSINNRHHLSVNYWSDKLQTTSVYNCPEIRWNSMPMEAGER